MGTGLTDTIMQKMEEFSIDEVLRCLIVDSDLEEVVSCLDMIAKESGLNVEMHKNGVQVYPVTEGEE